MYVRMLFTVVLNLSNKSSSGEAIYMPFSLFFPPPLLPSICLPRSNKMVGSSGEQGSLNICLVAQFLLGTDFSP